MNIKVLPILIGIGLAIGFYSCKESNQSTKYEGENIRRDSFERTSIVYNQDTKRKLAYRVKMNAMTRNNGPLDLDCGYFLAYTIQVIDDEYIFFPFSVANNSHMSYDRTLSYVQSFETKFTYKPDGRHIVDIDMCTWYVTDRNYKTTKRVSPHLSMNGLEKWLKDLKQKEYPRDSTFMIHKFHPGFQPQFEFCSSFRVTDLDSMFIIDKVSDNLEEFPYYDFTEKGNIQDTILIDKKKYRSFKKYQKKRQGTR